MVSNRWYRDIDRNAGLIPCQWCGALVPQGTACVLYDRDDESAWAYQEQLHNEDCVWVQTRGGQVPQDERGSGNG